MTKIKCKIGKDGQQHDFLLLGDKFILEVWFYPEIKTHELLIKDIKYYNE